MREWVDRIPSVDGGSIDVVKQDLGIRVGKVDLSGPKVCVPHTTEGHTLPSYTRGAPTIDVGPRTKGGQIITRQLIPFGWMGTALQNDAGGIETNRRVLVQIEQVAFTARELWLPPKAAVIIMASWAEWLEKELGIPQVYPYDPKDMRSGVWAVEGNPWRNSGKFTRVGGWHPHAAVPENDHWDCGGEDFPAILRMKPQPKMVTAFQLTAAWPHKHEDGNHRHVEQVSPFFARKRDVRTWMVKPVKSDDDKLRRKVWLHLREGHRIYIAERQVDPTEVRVRKAA